jgi:PAS domain S-box-containing protein
MVGVPLNSGSQVVGVLALAHEGGSQRIFGDEEVELLTRFAQLASIALDNARLYTETEQRVAELALVNSVGQAAASQLELQVLVELVGEKLREIFSAQIVYIALLDRSRERIDFPYYYEDGPQKDQGSIAFGEGLTSKVLKDRRPLLLNDEDEITALNVKAIGTPVRSYLGVPVHFGGEATGVISVQNTEQEGAFTDADVRLLTTIAANVGLAIQNARLFEETQREKDYLESLLEISPVAIVTLDPDSNILSWNPAAERLFGYQLAEVTGRNIDALIVPPELYSEAVDYSRQAWEPGGMHAITRRRRKDNTLVDVEVLALPVNVAGERVGFLAIYHDISDLQRAREEAEAATQAKSAFLATMSHEIRTPMNAIIGMSSLLLNTELTPEQQEFAEIIRVGGENLLTIINDILDFSKIEAGRMELENEPFELRAFLESAMDLLAGKAAEKKLDLAYEIEPGVPSSITGDITRLRQILLNLLNNALKFTEKGEVVLSVSSDQGLAISDRGVATGDQSLFASRQSPVAGDSPPFELHFSVRDTGIGIPPDRLDRLFRSFSQVDASTSRRYGGTGLGLAISKRLVELMGGEMWVESQVGVGTSFHFTIQTMPAEGFQPQPRWSGEQPELAGRRLLIVDDNDTNRRILSLHTQAWGMLSQDTASPLQALEWVRRGDDFDAAILDVQMPEMDGIALAQEIRRLKKALPLVMFSSLGQRELDGEANKNAASLFAANLTKPLKPSQLYDALINLFGASGKAPEARRKPAQGEKLAIDPGMAERLPLRILLAEDNLVNQKLALRMLQQMGYQADVAANGLETIRALESRPYDVILMDVQMPEMDGLEATRQIIQRWGAGRPRIIAMTANAMQGDRETFLRAGMDDYLSKPVRVDELVEALQHSRREGEATKSVAGAQGNGGAGERGSAGAGEPER